MPTQSSLLRLAFPLVLLFAAAPQAGAQQAGAQQAAEHECERVTQPPRLSMGRLSALAEGVSYAALRGSAARTICMRAMAEAPGEMRSIVYAAHASDKTGDSREAVRPWMLAAEQGSIEALNNLRKVGVR